MSSPRRQRDAVAPTLFPFLAVLLCTMGALVLILMLIVAGAQADTQQATREKQMRLEEAQSQIELAQDSYARQLEEKSIELEKKRLVLQHLEEHIQELLAELEQIQRTIELSEEESEIDAAEQEQRARQISELEKQLAKATKELETKLEDPQGDKPVFAIIPYDGPHGTHRRPIYLECVEQGVLIQPEGILLSIDDLRPPHGPGNPLDAALRTIRSQFKPENGAVTSTPYPLLIVRPSGIRSYALARAAMSGWDDQFGYELIGEKLELSFPPSAPGLESRITQAIDIARQRQAALVMAMPRKYGQLANRGTNSSSESIAVGQGATPFGFAGTAASSSTGTPYDSTDSPATGGPGGRSGVAFDPGSHSASSQPGSTGGDEKSLISAGYGGSDSRQQSGATDFGAATATDYSSIDDGSMNSIGANTSNTIGDGVSGTGVFGADGFGGGSSNSQSSGTGRSSGSSGASVPSGQASSGGAGATGPSGIPNNPTQQQENSISFDWQASGSAARTSSDRATHSTHEALSSQDSDSSGMASNSNNRTTAPNQPRPSTASGSTSESTAPVARRRGRNWAWSHGPRTQTPIVRSITLRCLPDRWVLLPEFGTRGKETTILLNGSLHEHAQQLAKAVAERVESWGLALSNGYWQPVLVVEVANDGEWRYRQLAHLLEGSGLEIQRR